MGFGPMDAWYSSRIPMYPMVMYATHKTKGTTYFELF